MNDLYIIKGAVEKETCKVLARELRIIRDMILYPNHADKVKGDDIVENSFSWYAPAGLEALADVVIKDIVEEVTELKLYNCYSYGRISYHDAILPKHRDRASADVAVSLLVDTDHEWPLHIEVDNTDHEVIQDIGDMVIYNGNTMEHWREPFKGTEQIGAFMMYVTDKKRELEGRPLQGVPYDPHYDPNAMIDHLESCRKAHGVNPNEY